MGKNSRFMPRTRREQPGGMRRGRLDAMLRTTGYRYSIHMLDVFITDAIKLGHKNTILSESFKLENFTGTRRRFSGT
jgi:hypothetical protein